ncbi:hypothetical protein [Calycomorphotria hydatis]|uniref:Protein kinase domain-containing protein n=1 Tax=Calycomorphotria hydatis TaxID=2528027 RepID=A0A517TEW3_9PLAN|nr:hypothetical protein [Calycomorphotria hydatis]QDT66912.1 hypothetical protein V22_41840 [Calycomorphotria hydatis]
MIHNRLVEERYSLPIEHARSYAVLQGMELANCLGWGFDGIVFGTTHRSVVKAHVSYKVYQQELVVYQRLKALEIHSVEGFRVPRLVGQNSELHVIEMTTVTPPYVLDFVAAGIDGPLHDWPEEVLRLEREKYREEFGKNWPMVARLLSEFRKLGIFLSDIHPRNIAFIQDDIETPED